ncbi:MAG: cation/multidrug efflux pump [Gammaproteobacteria bacterium]|nr:MAG: cation/multidrug efflux pump [Gammaproteobacteria bacterium]
MDWVSYAAAGVGLVALMLLVSGISRCRQRRLVSGLARSGLGALLLVAAFGTGSVAVHLYTYQRLTGEQPIADIAFQQIGPREYTAVLSTPGANEPMQFLIQGDEWQLDARFLKWEGPAVLAGMDSLVRLERIAGRYSDIDEERGERRSVYPLQNRPTVDFWQLFYNHPRWIPWIDAVYGSATYMPMGDGARFIITATQSGLVARPYDQATERMLRDW